jgi:hypothetical protein
MLVVVVKRLAMLPQCKMSLLDQGHRPTADVLALHAQGPRLVSETQYRLQGRCRLTADKTEALKPFAVRQLAVPNDRLGSEADMATTPRDVRFTPKADIGCVSMSPRP